MYLEHLQEVFDGRVFTVGEAAAVLAGEARKTLSHLALEGHLERVGRGRYRVAPEARSRVLRSRLNLRRQEVLASPFRVALDGPDAVRLWTGGRYTITPATAGDAVWLAVDAEDAGAFRAWLDETGISVGTRQEWPPGGGFKVILRPVPDLDVHLLDGAPVVSRREVERLIDAEPTAYEGAREWLLEA